MGKTIEPCIHSVGATKRYPAGFRVRKWIKDQWGESRQVTQTFRPGDDSPEARAEALEDARNFVEQLEREKRKGKVYRRFEKKPLDRSKKVPGYGIAWHEYPEEEHAAINRELEESHYKELREHKREVKLGRQTFKTFMEETHLPWYEENTSKSNFQKKRSAWRALKTYDKETGTAITSKTIGRIRPSEVDEFVSWLASRKKDGRPYYSKSSVKGYFALVRSFFKNWAAEEGLQNPADPALLKTDTARLRGREKTEKVATADQLAKLDKGIEKAIEESGKRYKHLRLILRYVHRVLMGTGMRVSEVLYLSKDHLDTDEMTITIEGAVVDGEPGLTKTGKRLGSKEAGTRVIPMSESVMETIAGWIDLREKHGYPSQDECSTIFCRRDGSYYTDDQIRSYYNRACDKAKMGGNITPHQIRHTTNDRLRRAGVASEIRQAILGHADAETNEGYTSVKALEARDVINTIG